MAKYKVLRDCYGFQNRYWEKGEIAEIDPKENPPHQFERIDDGEKKTGPISSVLALTRKEMISEAKKRGIKNPQTLSNEKLKEALAKPQT